MREVLAESELDSQNVSVKKLEHGVRAGGETAHQEARLRHDRLASDERWPHSVQSRTRPLVELVTAIQERDERPGIKRVAGQEP